eukprot:1413812-Pyramimonas_sp.AAC.1
MRRRRGGWTERGPGAGHLPMYSRSGTKRIQRRLGRIRPPKYDCRFGMFPSAKPVERNPSPIRPYEAAARGHATLRARWFRMEPP